MPRLAHGFDLDRLDRVTPHMQTYVTRDRIAGWSCDVQRDGASVWQACGGLRDREAGLAVEPDTVFRIYSMTKPVTSVAAMMLVEAGQLALTDPVAEFIPAFADQQVYRSGSRYAPALEPVSQPMQIIHLLTHTSGLTYDFLHAHPVDAMYRDAGFTWGHHPDADLAEACEIWARAPLLFQPGAEWNYSVATDVLGRVVELVSGETLDRFFHTRIFAPLGMRDTGFQPGEAQLPRLAALYQPNADRTAERATWADARAHETPRLLSGGGGLYGTLGDYQRFCQLLLNGGELDGARLLGTRTVARMLQNHLPGQRELTAVGRPLFSETAFSGMGFGLGFSIVVNPADTPNLCSAGEAAWGGAASTAFWVDPHERLSVV
ncbi:MAG: serine hydrolase domain-containing protein [Pseudomonadota bacterium]